MHYWEHWFVTQTLIAHLFHSNGITHLNNWTQAGLVHIQTFDTFDIRTCVGERDSGPPPGWTGGEEEFWLGTLAGVCGGDCRVRVTPGGTSGLSFSGILCKQ